jgi:hypothetical protein
MNLENKIEVQRRRMEQEKNKLDMLVKKARAEESGQPQKDCCRGKF